MSQPFYITEDNLLGSIAKVMLNLKKLKEKKEEIDISIFSKILEFMETANREDYDLLLYDKHFIISELDLKNIHKELKESEVTQSIDFKELREVSSKISLTSNDHDIDMVMSKLKSIAMVLWQMKRHNQMYM